ncbi:carcinoembryonic antigen-related cell adhesion molecule 5-like isoform X2 [Silurus meridionalis]|uniref:carcinoembryonic antigen-related cell adhesion molecule 5-like isoform X2 n=1 Tax=Silurus meridionalis TaxID=175797 RepID=UPI001EEC8379|nr:carcinoembryonic antigen-related cell adhesion molecule 5-like isoform X2 [Silurus meridionalis]
MKDLNVEKSVLSPFQRTTYLGVISDSRKFARMESISSWWLLVALLKHPPWEIPLRTDLLSQARGTIVHPTDEPDTRLKQVSVLIALIPVPHAEGTQKAVLSIQPDNQVYKGENVTLKCDIQGGGDTEWRYIWMKDNQVYANSTMPEIHINSVNKSYTGNYTCRGQKNHSQHLELSDAVTLNVSEKPQPLLSVSSKNWLTEGDSVTLSCEVKDSFSDRTFSFHKVVPCKVNDSHIKYKLLLLSDSNRGSGGSYTLSHVVLNHTGLYRCRGERGNPAFSTKNSSPKPLWITGESPPVSLIISPNRSQHFANDSLSLSCEDQSHSSKRWTVRRYMQKMKLANCSQWELSLGSTLLYILYVL